MTVQDMIEKLQTMPPDAEVIHSMMSEWCELDEPTLWTAEERKIIKHHGRYMSFNEHNMMKGGPEPNFVTVVYFPGN